MPTPATTGRSLLKRFLRKNKLSQADLARAMGVSAPTIHDWLDGAKKPVYKRRQKLAHLTSNAVPIDAWESAATMQDIRETAPLAPAVQP